MLNFETRYETITDTDFKFLAIDVLEGRIADLESSIHNLELKKIMSGLHTWQRSQLEQDKKTLETNFIIMRQLNPSFRVRN